MKRHLLHARCGFQPAQFLVLVALLLGTLKAFATAQAPDRITLDGEAQFLQTNPLSSLPPDLYRKIPRPTATVSSNWRGHIASWAIMDGTLVLQSIDILEWTKTEGAAARPVERNVIAELFPNGPPVVATWFTGTLVVPMGKLVDYVHMGYGSTYERYVLLSVAQGRVTSTLRLTEQEFVQLREQRLDCYRRTPEYQAMLERLMASEPAMPRRLLEEVIGHVTAGIHASRPCEPSR